MSDSANAFKESAKGYFESFRENTRWQPTDSFLTKVGKTIMHILGIFVLIALSPVLLFGLTVAFLIAL